jgi:ribonuclease BN (tRNA processing enzyme)
MNSKFLGSVRLHAPYHPSIVIKLDKIEFRVDSPCGAKNENKVYLLTHFHFDHVRSCMAGGADFLSLSENPIKIYAPYDDRKEYGETENVFDIHSKMINFHSKGRRKLVPIQENENLRFNGTTVVPVPLKHTVPNFGYYISNSETSALITGDWEGSNYKNRQKIISLAPRVLITECRYFFEEEIEVAEERLHVHVEDILDLKEELENTMFIITHISHRYRELDDIVKLTKEKDLIFAKNISFNNTGYRIRERFK